KRELLAWHGHGVDVIGLGFDVMLAAYLVNTRLRVAPLSVLADDLCDIRIEPEESLLGSGRNKIGIADVPVDTAANYYGAWVAALRPVRSALELQLEKQHVRALLDEIELPLVPILAAMELRGIAVDCDLLQRISTELHERIGAI